MIGRAAPSRPRLQEPLVPHWEFPVIDPTLARRDWFAASAAMLAGSTVTAKQPPAKKRYAMKKSINLWAFPYPSG